MPLPSIPNHIASMVDMSSGSDGSLAMIVASEEEKISA